MAHPGHDKPLDIVVVGGSFAGLMSGILLKRQGHNVRILERAATFEREGLGTGIGMSLQLKKFFETQDRLKDVLPMAVANDDMLFLDRDLKVTLAITVFFNMTTWDAAYYRLRANFDAMKSTHCPDPPYIQAEGSEGKGIVEVGKNVTKVEDQNGRMIIYAENVRTKELEHFQGDIVIVADGANSTIRNQVYPGLQKEEPGYVIWRGTVKVSELPADVVERFIDQCLVQPGHRTYCIIYTIPGDDGSLEPDRKHFNFAWYFRPALFSLSDIMTDVDGKRHRNTVPKGKLDSKIWEAQIKVAHQTFSPEICSIIDRITEPFVSIVTSVATPRAAFFDNRVFLVGDALAQIQPNTGMGGNMAANAATSLAELIGPAGKGMPGPVETRQWERKILELTQINRVRSVAYGSWYLSSWPYIAWSYSRFYALMWWQRWFGVRKRTYVLFRD